jgi:hypothetical protein
MSDYVTKSSALVAPIGGGSAPEAEQRIANTGTTEANNSTALRIGEFATLKNGANAIRVSFRSATGVSTAVATTSLLLGPYERFDWYVKYETQFVYAEAGDGASAYECWVWHSSA